MVSSFLGFFRKAEVQSLRHRRTDILDVGESTVDVDEQTVGETTGYPMAPGQVKLSLHLNVPPKFRENKIMSSFRGQWTAN